jgi:exopolyphosphatase/guanosine-5'-triphosphate,3'-diphosphate pyrophosphatase
MNIGIIDLGTNQIHLLIASTLPDGSVKVLYKEDRPVRLGEGGITEQRITDAARERALSALSSVKNILEQHNCAQVYAVATSAVRNASNGSDFINEVHQHTGIQIEVIDGDREAQLIYEGITSSKPLKEPSLIMDIGGGSVEFIFCSPDRQPEKFSFEAGAQRLLYRFHHIDPIPPENVGELNKYLDLLLEPLRKASERHRPYRLIGSAGVFETLWHIYQNRQPEAATTKESTIPLADFLLIHQELLLKSKQERGDIPGMAPERRGMIVVSSCLVHYVLAKLQIERFEISESSLREGLLASVLKNQAAQ